MGQMAQVVSCSLLVRDVCGSNLDPIKSPTCCQRFATATTFEVWALVQSRGNVWALAQSRENVWALAQSCGDGLRSLVTPERVLSEKAQNSKNLRFNGHTSFKFQTRNYM